MFISNFNHVRLSLDNKRLLTYLLNNNWLVIWTMVQMLGFAMACCLRIRLLETPEKEAE